MQADLFQLIGYGALALLLLYVVISIRLKRARSTPPAKAAQAPDAYLDAIRENSALLRELIDVNRQLLQNREQQDR